MSVSPEIHGTSIVLRGEFAPATFQPAWLASNGLISEKEANAAEIDLIHSKATAFSIDWLQARILHDRFQFSTSQEAFFEILRDLVLGIFDILDQTPVRAIGLNQAFHFRVASEEAWHDIGDKLVPKSHWETMLNEPGMRSLVVEGVRHDDWQGYVRVQVEPSNRIPAFGIFIEVNDHYQLTTEGPASPKYPEILSILKDAWDDSMQKGSSIAREVAELGIKQ